MNEWMTIREVQRALDVSRTSIMLWIENGRVEARQDGDTPTSPWLIRRESIEALRREKIELHLRELEKLGFQGEAVPA